MTQQPAYNAYNFPSTTRFLLGDANVLIVQVDSIKHVEAGQAGQERQAPGEAGQRDQRGVGGEGRHDGPDPVHSNGHHQVGGARQSEGLEKFEQLLVRKVTVNSPRQTSDLCSFFKCF